MNRIRSQVSLNSSSLLLGWLFIAVALLYIEPALGQPQRGGRIPGGGTPSRQDPDAIYTGPPESSTPLKAEVSIVPVRVVVRDPRGHAITNLRKEDFKLQQDGKQQQIVNFSVVTTALVAPGTAGSHSNVALKARRICRA